MHSSRTLRLQEQRIEPKNEAKTKETIDHSITQVLWETQRPRNANQKQATENDNESNQKLDDLQHAQTISCFLNRPACVKY
jgi:hypothetical protein